MAGRRPLTVKVQAISWPKVSLFPHRCGGLVQTLVPLVIVLDGNQSAIIPEGFWSDGASVPQPAWIILRAKPLKLIVMGLAHDYAVRRRAVIQSPTGARAFTLNEATALAVAVADFCGVSKLDQRKIGAALSVAWRTYWRRRDVGWQP